MHAANVLLATQATCKQRLVLPKIERSYAQAQGPHLDLEGLAAGEYGSSAVSSPADVSAASCWASA